jgi:prolyl oligopeptidase
MVFVFRPQDGGSRSANLQEFCPRSWAVCGTMRRLTLLIVAAGVSLAVGGPAPAALEPPLTMPTALRYPATRATDARDTLFGVTVQDPYRWLEDAKSPEVREWMAAQDKLARDYLAALPGREALVNRLRELYYLDSISAPIHRGSRYFYTRRHADREKAVVYWREGAGSREANAGDERVLVDPNKMSADGSISLGVWVPTLDGKRVAYALRANNADEATLHVMDVASSKVSDVDVIDGARYASPEWTPRGDGFYYTYLPTDPNIPVDERPGYAEIRFHELGADPKKDPVVRERTGNPKAFLGVDLSRDGRWLFTTVQHGWNSTDVYYRDTQSNDPAWRPLAVGIPALFQVTAWKDRFYIFTNDGAPRWRIFRTAAENPGRENWKEIVPEPKDAVIEHAQVVGEHLVLTLLKNASSHLELRSLDGAPVRTISLPGIGAVNGVTGEPDEDEAYFSFASFTTPTQIFRTSIRTGENTLWFALKAPVDASPYQVEQVWYPSKDGAKVSMFIVRRKDRPRDGSTPFLLTGYGGFNVPMLPGFNAGLFPWLEAGGGYAVPNLRGGSEYGEEWHRAGMLHKKQTVFDDFVAAAEYLIKERYTRPERLAIRGGSNGGLLVGAAITQRPDLFRAAVCAVPLLDMVRYHLFGSGRTWIPEYGSAEDEAQFRTLFAYSPYHHVKHGTRYPAMLMMSADSDDRVDPMHARKMAALLQAANGSERPVLLRIEKHAGHGGADLVRQAVDSSADSYAFLMRELGMTPGVRRETRR